jgi:hypothetical protein
MSNSKAVCDRRRTRSSERAGVSNGQLGSLVTDGRNVFVVDDLDDIPLSSLLLQLVGNGSSFGKSRNFTSDLVESDDEIFLPGTRKLSLGLVSEDGEGGAGVFVESTDGGFGNRGVDTSTKTTVGGDGDVKGLGITSVGTDLGVLEEL